MKSLTEYLNEQLIFELSSELLKRAAHAAVDKGDLRQVTVFLNGAKKAEEEEKAQKEKEFINFSSYFRICSDLQDIYEKYGNLIFKRGWKKYIKQWVRSSGGSRYEGTDYDICATYGIILNRDFKDKMIKSNVDYNDLMKQFEDEVNDVVKKFYKEHPNPKFNFITKYESNEEAKKASEWEVEGDRSKYYVVLGLPDKPHPYSFGDSIFGINCCVTPGDEHKTSNGGGLGMPAVYITRGPVYAPSIIMNKYNNK